MSTPVSPVCISDSPVIVVTKSPTSSGTSSPSASERSSSSDVIELPRFYLSIGNSHLQKFFASKIITVEGTIGVGKTTFSRLLCNILNKNGVLCNYYEEPIQHDILSQFLRDKNRYAYTIQVVFLVRRQHVYENAIQNRCTKNVSAIIDRSVHGDYAFALLHYKAGRFTEDEWATYKKILNAESVVSPDLTFYLKCSSETAMSRISKRDRHGEKSAYDSKYIEDLISSHDTTMKMCKNVIPINFDDELTDEKQQRDFIINFINETIESHAK